MFRPKLKILPYLLFCWIIAVVMLPNIALCFTEGLTPVQDATGLLLPLGLYILFMCLSGNVGLMALWMLIPLFLAGFELVLLYLYGNSVIAVDMWLNLVTTNSHEAAELLTNLWPALVLVGILYLLPVAIGVVALVSDWRVGYEFRKISRRLAWVIISAGVVCMAFSFRSTRVYNPLRDIFPVNAVSNAVIAVNRFVATEHYADTSRDYTFGAHSTRPDTLREVYVLVIGETSRADHWEAFGYDRPTNPGWRNVEGLVCYPHTLSESNTTHKSVPLLLSPLSANEFGDSINGIKSLITAFREAGFHTSFISGQKRNHSYIDFFGNEADTCIFICDDITDHSVVDTDLLPYLAAQLDSTRTKQLIVFHTYGSHFSYPDRYTDADAMFKPDGPVAADISHKRELINAYDNSIVATWHMLHSMIDTLSESGVISALLYTSDHGEDLYDDARHLLLHASPRPSFYQLHVPFLVWMSPDYRNSFPSSLSVAQTNRFKDVASSESFFHTALDLAGIRYAGFNDSLSVMSRSYSSPCRIYLDDHNRGVALENSGLTEADFRAMSEAGISLQ